MRLKYRLTMVVMSILIIGVSSLVIISLYRSSKVQLASAKESLNRLAGQQALFIQGQYEGYLRVAKVLGGIMADFETIEPSIRRFWFRENMRAVLVDEQDLIGIFGVWKPNVLDGQDSDYAGTPGSTTSGQFVPYYHQEQGMTEYTSYPDVASIERDMARGEVIIGDPQPLISQGKEILTITIEVPVIHPQTKQVIALSGVIVNAQAIQGVIENIINTNADIYAVSVYSTNGTIIGSFIPDRVGKNYREVDTFYFGYETPLEQAIRNGQTFELTSYSELLKASVYTVQYPFIIGEGHNNFWSIMVESPEDVILQDIYTLSKFMIVLAIAVILIGAVITFMVAHRIAKPIVIVANTLKDISEGEGDLTKTVNVYQKDEIGDLAKYFNATMERIKGLIIIIRDQANGLLNIGSDLASNMTESAAAMNEITANIQNIKGRVTYQSTGVRQSGVTMEQITQEIHKLNGHIDTQSDSISRSSAAIEQMLTNIQSVTQVLVKNTANVKSLASASEVGRSGLQEVAEDIQEIARQSEGLLEINAVMENIASQTNLLSMNAAIEAAHAGEVGKGFAVVADEIRKLAESSGEQSKTIGVVLKKIKDSIDKISKSTDSVLNKFEAIDKGVRTVSDQEEYIRQAMEEQNAGSKQVLEAVGSVNDVTLLVKGSSKEMQQGSKEVIKESQNLASVTHEIHEGMTEMAVGADNVNVAVNKINELSVQNKDSIMVLVQEVSKFKVVAS
ncbi:MAG: methyl-accepting chemotaxis protein [Treponema sp.]|nr:methyl-accepting chemotaxis protein [Treponema sp.]